MKRQSTLEFMWARVLRIFPALLTMVSFTVFVLGLFFTTLPWSSYLSDPKTIKYLLRCSTLFKGVVYRLPGVFDSNPYGNAVNGSLWTMPYEVRMYALLAIVWSLLRLMRRSRSTAFKLTIISLALSAWLLVILAHLGITKDTHFMRLFFMFFTGAACFILKDRIALSHSIFCVFVVALMVASFNRQAFYVVYVSTLAYIVLYVAYIPSGLIRRYNKLGDYSYGVYIYAFPLQQSTAALIPGVSVLAMVIISSLVTFVFAALSWHLVEKHALKLKELYASHAIKLATHHRVAD